jgi:hypothetical protein
LHAAATGYSEGPVRGALAMSRPPPAVVKRTDTRADPAHMGQRLVFTRRRGFTPLTLLVAALDLAAIAAAAALWWVADAERHGENMPWAFGALVVLALLALVAWAVSAGRRRELLAASTILLIAAVLVTLFG